MGKGESFGVPGMRCDGMNVVDTHEVCSEALRIARDERRPVLVEALTYRFRGHSMADPEEYRTKEQVEEWRLRDPLRGYGDRLEREGVITAADREEIDAAAIARVDAAVSSPRRRPTRRRSVGNHSIRKISSTGLVTTLAGTSGSQGAIDGTAAAARFSAPTGLAVDSSGNLFVADTLTDTIRKVTPDGIVTTIAGRAFYLGSADGTGTAALFNQPAGIALDRSGNLYVSEMGNRTIRKITPAGVVTTLVGSATSRGVRLGPLPGSLGGPEGIAFLPGPTPRLVEVDSENVVLTIDIPPGNFPR